MKKSIVLLLGIYYCLSLKAENKDTIVFPINIKKYEEVAKEKLRESLSESFSFFLRKKYLKSELKTFSIPAFEWNQKAKEYACDNHERLENLLSFVENSYFQMILFIDNQSNIVGWENVAVSEIRTAKRERDSIDWVSQIPDIPYSPLLGNPFLHYDLKELNKVYKYHLKHPDAFIFRIADYEGFWVIKNNRLYKLEGGSLKNANQYFYMDGEEYIRDIATGDGMKIGFRYVGCYNAEEALYWSKKGKDIIILMTWNYLKQ